MQFILDDRQATFDASSGSSARDPAFHFSRSSADGGDQSLSGRMADSISDDSLLEGENKALIDEDVSDGHSTGVKAFVKPKRFIIVEPILALYFVAFVPGASLCQQFIYEKYSQKFNLSAYEGTVEDGNLSACQLADVNDTYYWVQQKVQGESAKFSVYLDLASTFISIPLVFVYGSFSDIFGRKPLMLLPLIGGVLKYIIYIAVITSNASIYLLLIGNAVESLFGGASTIISTCFAYIADTTDHDKRTLKITINEVIFSLANAAAQVILGFVINAFGFLYPFYGLLVIHVINMLYLLFFVPETRPYQKRRRIPITQVLDHVKDCFRVYSTPDQFGKRWSLALTAPCVFFCALVFLARWAPSILYMLNSPLCWTSVQIGIWGAILAVATNVGNIGMVVLFIRRLGDIGLAIVSCISGIASFMVMSVAVKTWIMLISPVIGFASFLSVPMLRAFGSKRTSSEKQGALFASFAAIEVLCGLAGTVLFTPIYGATLGFWKGFVFVSMAITQFLGLVFLVILQLYARRSKSVHLVNVVQGDVTTNQVVNT